MEKVTSFPEAVILLGEIGRWASVSRSGYSIYACSETVIEMNACVQSNWHQDFLVPDFCLFVSSRAYRWPKTRGLWGRDTSAEQLEHSTLGSRGTTRPTITAIGEPPKTGHAEVGKHKYHCKGGQQTQKEDKGCDWNPVPGPNPQTRILNIRSWSDTFRHVISVIKDHVTLGIFHHLRK